MVLQNNKLRLDPITNIKIRLFINNFLSFKNKLLSLKSRFKKSRKKLSLIHPKRVRKIGKREERSLKKSIRRKKEKRRGK